MPALLTSTRSGLPVATAASTAACTCALSDTSVLTKTPPISSAMLLPRSSLRSAMTTVEPARASSRAVASPRPLAPPEMIAADPFTSIARTLTRQPNEVLLGVGSNSAHGAVHVRVDLDAPVEAGGPQDARHRGLRRRQGHAAALAGGQPPRLDEHGQAAGIHERELLKVEDEPGAVLLDRVSYLVAENRRGEQVELSRNGHHHGITEGVSRKP